MRMLADPEFAVRQEAHFLATQEQMHLAATVAIPRTITLPLEEVEEAQRVKFALAE